jgi:hypothetical protein
VKNGDFPESAKAAHLENRSALHTAEILRRPANKDAVPPRRDQDATWMAYFSNLLRLA